MKSEPYRSLIPGLQLSVRAALSAGLSVAIARLLDLPHPLYAMIGAVIVTDLSPSKTREMGIQRFIGSMMGAGTGALACHILQPSAWGIGFSVLVAMFLGYLFRMPAAAKLSGYVCGIVVLGYDDHAWTYSFFRLIETVLGIILAVLVSFIPKLISYDESTTLEKNGQ